MSENGVPKNLVDASLHQMEIKLKKISGGFPYGLQLLMGSLPSILHEGDVINAFDLENLYQYWKDWKRWLYKLKSRNVSWKSMSSYFSVSADKDFDRKQQAKFDELLKEKQITIVKILKK